MNSKGFQVVKLHLSICICANYHESLSPMELSRGEGKSPWLQQPLQTHHMSLVWRTDLRGQEAGQREQGKICAFLNVESPFPKSSTVVKFQPLYTLTPCTLLRGAHITNFETASITSNSMKAGMQKGLSCSSFDPQRLMCNRCTPNTCWVN